MPLASQQADLRPGRRVLPRFLVISSRSQSRQALTGAITAPRSRSPHLVTSPQRLDGLRRWCTHPLLRLAGQDRTQRILEIMALSSQLAVHERSVGPPNISDRGGAGIGAEVAMAERVRRAAQREHSAGEYGSHHPDGGDAPAAHRSRVCRVLQHRSAAAVTRRQLANTTPRGRCRADHCNARSRQSPSPLLARCVDRTDRLSVGEVHPGDTNDVLGLYESQPSRPLRGAYGVFDRCRGNNTHGSRCEASAAASAPAAALEVQQELVWTGFLYLDQDGLARPND